MAALATDQVGPVEVPSSSQTTRHRAQHDMNYYLTAGLEGVERREYHSIRSFSKAIDSLHDEFDSGNWSAGQYLVFVSVTHEHLANIHHLREIRRRHRGIGIMYLKSEEVLVVKVIPSVLTERTHLGFGSMLHRKTTKMGLRHGLCPAGRTTFEGIIGQKEADSTFQAECRMMAADWPTIVFECGLSQSLERLRVDSRWWLENSAEVNIVLLFALSRANKGIHLEQWEVLTAPNSRVNGAQPDPLSMVLTKTNEIDIVEGVATGAPLIFDFQKVFLRPPVLGEGDIVFSAQKLEIWAAHTWAGIE